MVCSSETFVRWENASTAIYRQLNQVKEIKNETLYNIQKSEFTQLDTFLWWSSFKWDAQMYTNQLPNRAKYLTNSVHHYLKP